MRIIVVGAGIAGLSSAWALTGRGHQVSLIEQGEIPNPLAASGDHHRIIRRAYAPDSGYGHLISEAYDAWARLWDDLGETHYDHRGFMAVSREPGDEAETYLEGMRVGGYPFERLVGDGAVERWPFLDGGTFRYAFHSPEGGALHCRQIARAMVRWLRRNGADVRAGTRVEAVDHERGIVRLDGGETLEGDRIVVAAGAWVLKLFPSLATALAPKRTAVVYLDPPSDLAGAWESAPVMLDVGGSTDGYILPPSGGGGLKFGSGMNKRAAPDPDRDRATGETEGEYVRDLFSPPIARIAEYRVVDTVSCVYTFTADERFFSRTFGRVTVISACSGHGYKFGAAVGRRMADAIESSDLETLENWLLGQVDRNPR